MRGEAPLTSLGGLDGAPVRRAKGDVMAFLPRIVLMAYIAILVSVALAMWLAEP